MRSVYRLLGLARRYDVRDMRKLHGLRFARDQNAVDRVLAGRAPSGRPVGRRAPRPIKPAPAQVSPHGPVDHRRPGNLLADEILRRARLHPRRLFTQGDRADFARLHARMRTVLKHAIAQGRVPPRKTGLTGRRDEPSGSCPRCGTRLAHGRVGGRSTVWCPRCQHG